jgi:hypothetical protein
MADLATGASATLATAVAVTWTLLGTQAFVSGLPIDNCGCFGVHLGQPLRWSVLLEAPSSSPGRLGAPGRPARASLEAG